MNGEWISIRTLLSQLLLWLAQHGCLEVDGLRAAFHIEGVYGYCVDTARMQATHNEAGYR